MHNTKRYIELDIVRGGSILYVIFIHAAIYNYERLNELTSSRIPIYLLVIGAVGLWGGVFAVSSLLVNTASVLRKKQQKIIEFRVFGYLMLAGLLYFTVIATLQTLFLGRWSVGSNSSSNLTVVAEALRGQGVTIHLSKLLDGSGIKMIGLNLMIVPLVLYGLFRRSKLRDEASNYLLLGVTGLVILLLSFTRIYLYNDWVRAVIEDNWLAAIIGSLFIAGPYPGMTFLSYGFFGATLAMMFYYQRRVYLRRYILPLGIALIAIGGFGLSVTTASLFSASWFLYFKYIAEAGIFVSGFSLLLLAMLRQKKQPSASRTQLSWLSKPIMAVSRISLTAYLFETLTSELLRHIWFFFNPAWTTSIKACLLLGVTNVLIWVLIALAWRRWNFRYSVEDVWVRFFALIGKNSTKLSS